MNTPAPVVPPGTFRIDRDGAWRHEGQEVTHPGVLRSLYGNLRVDHAGHYLQVGAVRVPVDVDDAPFVVTRLESVSEQCVTSSPLRIHINDGAEEPLDPAGLWLAAGETPYCRVKSGRFVARFSLAAWLQLAALLEEEPGTGRPVLVLADRRVAIPRRP